MKKKWILFIISLLCCGLFIQFQAAARIGDANRDGTVNIVDALVVARYYVGINEPLPDPAAADVNCSGDITIVDALMIARYYVGLITSLPGCEAVYPTTLAALSDAKIIELQAEFDALNNGAVFGKVGPYGLLINYSIPYGQAPSGNPLTDEAEVLQVARAALVKNAKFTNITSSTPLDTYRVIHATAGSNWTIEFKFNSYKNIPCKYTFISVEVNREAYCIEYHFYPDNITIPGSINITPEQAQVKVLGKVLTYYDVAGQPREYIVTEDALTVTPANKWIIPYEINNRLEYRYSWQVPVLEGMWDIFVDVVTGEVVHVEQNFVT